jgi:ribosomal protein S18 acetylase RimI-like enzyme
MITRMPGIALSSGAAIAVSTQIAVIMVGSGGRGQWHVPHTPPAPDDPSAIAGDSDRVAGPAADASPAHGASPDPDLVLVRLTLNDAGELLTLQRAAYVTQAQLHDDPNLPPLTQTLDELHAVLVDPAATTLGLRLVGSGRLVGAVRVTQRSPSTAELSRLAVAPDLQGRGHGSRLMLAALAAVQPGTQQIELFTGEHSLANLRLYERHGYRETHRTPAGTHQLVHLVKHL